MAIDGQLFRAVLGSFPTGVTIVTTVGSDGAPRGLTCNAVCSVSAEPPLLLFCIGKKAGSVSSCLETKAFVEDLLETDEASRIFNALDDGLTIVRELAQSGTPIGDFLRAGLGRLRRR